MLTALLLGDAGCVHEDAKAALKLFTPDAIAATSNIGIEWGQRLDYWCTLHPEPCKDWIGVSAALQARISAGLNRPQIWAHRHREGVDMTMDDWGGSSGLFAVRVLLSEGFSRIVLAGVPMSADQGHFYSKHVWAQCARFVPAWRNRKTEIEPYVRSMSGWTRELLGAPSQDWLACN